MSNAFFRFKQFTIEQQGVSMKVNTDGVLLGAWAAINQAVSALDVGTGTGVIALMLAQRNPHIRIDAVEKDKASAQQALENIRHSHWPHRITVFQESFQRFARQCTAQYDLIISNPPYFVNALPSPFETRTRARHTEELTHEELIFYTQKLLTPHGALCVILPFAEGSRFLGLAAEQGLFCTHKTTVYSIRTKPPKRLLLRFAPLPSLCTETELAIHENDGIAFSDNYKKLTGDFYLKF
jgi:tRNA1Val (adenine37-N6)-methyltransferase